MMPRYPRFCSFAHASFSVIVRLKISRSGVLSRSRAKYASRSNW